MRVIGMVFFRAFFRSLPLCIALMGTTGFAEPASTAQMLDIQDLGPCTNSPDRRLHLRTDQPLVVLVHGCFASAGRFRALSQVFEFHGQQTACFSYDDRDRLMQSSSRLINSINKLAAAGIRNVTLIGHSQGGLIARKALVRTRSDALRQPDLQLQLITISSPFAGIDSARHCASSLGRIMSLGITSLVCQIVTGSKWRDITYAAEFIREPGELIPQTQRYIKIITDERNSCREQNASGGCVEDDYVFSLEEQYYAPIDTLPRSTLLRVQAGHVEIVGDQDTAPEKLIQILQVQSILHATPAAQQAAWRQLLAEIYH